MPKALYHTIYIDRDPDDFFKGWGWVEVAIADAEQFQIPIQEPVSRHRLRSLSYEEMQRLPNRGNLPSKGRAGRNRFLLMVDEHVVVIRAHRSLTAKSLCAWLRTWAAPEARLVSPGNRVYSLEHQTLMHQAHFVYFILNEHSRAIKIGRASNVIKRLKSLQTSSPTPLKLLRTIPAAGYRQAKYLESQLHDQFSCIRLQGEWFKAEPMLLEYIETLDKGSYGLDI